MQVLRGRGWVNAMELPAAIITLGKLIDKRWIERREAGKNREYRLTDEGLVAKTARVPIERRRTRRTAQRETAAHMGIRC